MAKKERKKTVEEIRIIDCFKKYVEAYAAKTNYVNSVSIYEQSAKENFRVVATLDCGLFQQRIIYYSMFSFEANFVDTEFSFEDSEYSFMLYDIFNLFDIEDFNLYYYSGVETEEETENAVKNIFEATENYMYYLEKAASSDYLPNLIKNYETDMDSSWGDYDWREEEKDIDDVFFAPINHPSMSFADGNITEKAIRKLKKKNEKGKLDTLYEKRLLKYIEAGNKVVRKNVSDKEEFEKLYRRKTIFVNFIVFICSFVCVLILSFSLHAVIFKGAVIYPTTWDILGIKTTIPVGRIGLCLVTAIILMIEILLLFGRKLVVKNMPDNMKNLTENKYNKESRQDLGIFAKPLRIIGAILVPVLALLCFSASLDDIGYYDAYVKYTGGVEFGTVDVSYTDLEIYKVKGYFDEDDEFTENENAYAISDGNGNYYDYGELVKGGKTETKLKEIAKQYNKEIVEIETIMDLSE